MALKRRRKTYGRWAGSPNGVPENVTRCRYQTGEMPHYHQCYRKRGYGPRKVFCKQHAKMFAENRLMFGEDYI